MHMRKRLSVYLYSVYFSFQIDLAWFFIYAVHFNNVRQIFTEQAGSLSLACPPNITVLHTFPPGGRSGVCGDGVGGGDVCPAEGCATLMVA